MEVDHDLVIVDEFDALAIEVKVPPPTKEASQDASRKRSSSGPGSTSARRQMNEAWLFEKLGKYPAKTHAKKVAKELGAATGLIYLPGQDEKYYEDSDMGPEFRQRRHFYYLSGANFAGCSLTYDISRDHLILWIPYTDPKTVLWFGSTPSVDDCKAASDVDDVRLANGLERFLYTSLSPGSTLYVLHPDQKPKLENTKGVVHIDTSKLLPAIDAARVVKTDYEVAMIRRANAVSSAAHKAVMARMKKLQNEREIEAIFRGFSLAQGAKTSAYPVIAGSGPNAGVLHYAANNQPLAGRQLVVLDAGAEWNCYASDVTRTIPIGGKFTAEGQAIYSVVERMQTECVQRVKPGVVYYTLHLHACIVAVTELLKLGILHNGTAAEIFNRGTIAAFFPHGLGHHVGLEVHDVSGNERLILGASVGSKARKGGSSSSSSSSPVIGSNSNCNGGGASHCGGAAMMPPKREWMSPEMLGIMYRDAVTLPPPYKGRQKLEKNMVVTIEPGIYFCREYIQAYFLDNPMHAKYINKKVLEKYYDVGGVRIEDCILVTEDGYENLTTAPRGEEMMRILNSSTEY